VGLGQSGLKVEHSAEFDFVWIGNFDFFDGRDGLGPGGAKGEGAAHDAEAEK